MARQAYITCRFQAKSLRRIERANAILDEFGAQGHDLTLRQLYYQFVTRLLIPNNQREYDNLGELVSKARLAGLIDWDQIVDRGRVLHTEEHMISPRAALEDIVTYYHLDYWANQDYRPEVWVEKEALVDVVGRACRPLDVPYIAVKGYNSQSTMRARALQLAEYKQSGQQPIIFYLGDHDPSGLDMTRDAQDRANLFAGSIPVRRLALNWDQVQTYRPPPNFAKHADSRTPDYRAKYGDECWELDALSPTVISGLVENAINSVRDSERWTATTRQEATERAQLQEMAQHLPSN